MQTIEANYEDGKFYLNDTPKVKKSKVLITFIEEIEDEKKESKSRILKKINDLPVITEEEALKIEEVRQEINKSRIA